jgi:hypothetical protein
MKADLSMGQAPALVAMVLMKSNAGAPILPKASCVNGINFEPWTAAILTQASSLSPFPLVAE